MHASVSTENQTLENARGTLEAPRKLVNAPTLLTVLWEEDSRPSLRWLRQQQANKSIPYVKLGALVFFYPDDVRRALEKRHTINAKGVK